MSLELSGMENRTKRHIVIVGGGFAGIAAAHSLHRLTNRGVRISLIDPSPTFVFAPTLVDYALGRTVRPPEFSLRRALEPRGVEVVRGYLSTVDLERRLISGEDLEMGYDALLIATGGRPDSTTIPGASGEGRHNHYIVGQTSAQDVANAVTALEANDGRIVVGLVPGASYVSAMYELALGLELALRRRHIRERNPITFVTPEPFLGDFGLGQTAARDHFEKLFRDHDIDVRANTRITRVDRDAVFLNSDEQIETTASFLMPAFTGSVDIWKSAGLTDDRGFVPVNHLYRHVHTPEVFAVGIAAIFSDEIAPLGARRAPQTGFLSTRMGRIAAVNIAATLGFGDYAARTLPHLVDARILDLGESGLLLTSRGATQLRHHAAPVPGWSAHVLKRGSARYLTHCLARGWLRWM